TSLLPLRVEPACELLDFALCVRELRSAAAIELLASLPQLRQLLEPDVAALEPSHDLLQLRLRLLECLLGHSERAPKRPPATSTWSADPAAGGSRTSRSPVRTIAYPRSSVARGESMRRRA